jgi:hypothetical protein
MSADRALAKVELFQDIMLSRNFLEDWSPMLPESRHVKLHEEQDTTNCPDGIYSP